MTTPVLFALFVGLSLALPPVAPQEAHLHLHPEGDVHGSVRFPTTCKPALQATYDRAVALLHSFGYEEARRDFELVAEQDPACSMAWWGVAMTYFHQHWDQPTPAELSAGRAAAQKAAAVGANTKREQAYIAAIGAFYRDTDARNHPTRALAYREAMKRLAADFPEDSEASIFYALALLATRRPDDTTYSNQKQAAEILNRLLPDHPEHPGIIHYTIHAFDYPELAEFALRAARTYAKIAPDSPHALHMPSHIFTRLGLWEESIASNLDVARVAVAQVARTHPGAVAFEHLHADDYLVYAYLQLGDDEKARRVVEEVASTARLDDPNFAAAYALVAVPARFALERRDWRAAAMLEPPAIDLRWENFPYARGNTYYARALGAAHIGELERARQAVRELTKLQTALAAEPPRGPYDWAGRIEAMRLAADGWLAHAEGRADEARRLLTAAADLEEKVGKHPVTPGPILPAREQLGDLLLELGRPQEALAAYEAALAGSPKRYWSVAGAARAAELSDDRERAQKYYAELLALCRAPTCQRPEAKHAAKVLSER